jgi:hypothetical protein
MSGIVEKIEELKSSPGHVIGECERGDAFTVLTREGPYFVGVVLPAETRVVVQGGVEPFQEPIVVTFQGTSLGREADLRVGWLGAGFHLRFDLGRDGIFTTGKVLKVYKLESDDVERIFSGMLRRAAES